MLFRLALFIGLVLFCHAALAADSPKRPNIVWIITEDMSAPFGCYGESTIQTPHVDRLAEQGIKFTRAFTTAPVCSTSRSALITGMYQTSIGAHHHRSGRGEMKIQLPEGVTPLPALFQKAGYYTSNGSWPSTAARKNAKTDYNFEWDASIYNSGDWSDRGPGQPFFAQIQLAGGKLRHAANWPQRSKKDLGNRTSPQAVKLPPYYPRDPVILEDWAQYLDAARYTDMQVGQILERLDKEGLADSTYVFFITDHGISHARGKQFCYDEGIHIPFVVRGPGLSAGVVRDELIAHIDMAATSLALAGIEIPAAMQGRDLFGSDHKPREFVVSARDRCDETIDRIRSVRTDRYKYIRNFYPERAHLQPNAYKDNKEIVIALRRLHADGKLSAEQSLIMAPGRPAEELYDLQSDPWEVRNLANDPAQQKTLAELRANLNAWIRETGDRGETAESLAMYESDMKVYLGEIGPRDTARRKEIEENIRFMKDNGAK